VGREILTRSPVFIDDLEESRRDDSNLFTYENLGTKRIISLDTIEDLYEESDFWWR
jgi:hypothetical protein